MLFEKLISEHFEKFNFFSTSKFKKRKKITFYFWNLKIVESTQISFFLNNLFKFKFKILICKKKSQQK